MKPLLLGYNAAGRPIRLSTQDQKSHMHVIGSSGSGKSKFLEWFLRGYLRNRQGFCLIDPHGTLYNDIADYCAHHVMDRDVIQLNLSEPHTVIGFNPFQRAAQGDISVQVDRRIAATMHAWNVDNTDQTPTLARTLRLIYTVMLEQNLGLPQVQHLIDFNAQHIRGHLIENLQTPLIQKEWRELQVLRPKEWRDETLSAKNRLFKFLTSPTIARFMGLPDRSINLNDIMSQGKVLLINLAPSDYLSHENARVFGALLVNEFFEAALRRTKDERGNDPNPYHLVMDEFQNFVSLDIAEMLDQVRKFGLFVTCCHQRFGHLGEDIADAVLANCRIKAVFGGLPASSARMMAEELFIRDLDPKRIKVAVYQTKFWPQYSRDKVYTKGTTYSSSSGVTHSEMTGTARAQASGTVAGEFFLPGDWLTDPELIGTSSISTSTTSSISSEMSGRSTSESESYGTSESEADIPILLPVPFQELSSIQYYSPEEQLIELTGALKEQFQRHCFIKIHSQRTQPLLVPFVRQFYTAPINRLWYEGKVAAKEKALPAEEVDILLEAQENALLKKSAPRIDIPDPSDAAPQKPKAASRSRKKQPATKENPTIFDTIDLSDDEPIGRE